MWRFSNEIYKAVSPKYIKMWGMFPWKKFQGK
jgi:hypothetical protein